MKAVLTGLALAVTLTGCATIVGNNEQTLPISSTPSHANILITDEKGKQMFSGTTPTSVSLKKATVHISERKTLLCKLTRRVM